MGMKINAELPLPADLKAEYPLSEEILGIKRKGDREINEKKVCCTLYSGRNCRRSCIQKN